MLRFIVILSLCSAFTTAVPTTEPGFTSGPLNIVALLGEDIVFQCIIRNSETIFWRRDAGMVAYGYTTLFARNGRTEVEGESSTYRLRIRGVLLEDEGNYYCEIPGVLPMVQTHTLTVNIPSTIDKTQQETNLHVYLGDSVTLKCPAEGKPDPEVTWRREDDALPSGEKVFTGNDLQLDDLDRLDFGIYTCIASNGAGTPDTLSVELHVDYEPSVHMVEELIHSGPEEEVHIECRFSASPSVDVSWKHNGSDIDFELRGNLISEMHSAPGIEQWTIKIRNMQASDFGEYSCKGVNSLGEAEGTAFVSGLPHSLLITSDPHGPYSDQYTLRWDVQTLAQLVEFQMRFKQANGSDDFFNSSIPAPLDHDVPLHSQEFTFLNLESNSTFLVQLRARNSLGRSNWTDFFFFNTGEAGNEAPERTTTTRGPSTRRSTRAPATPTESNTSGSASSSSSFIFTLLFISSSFLLR